MLFNVPQYIDVEDKVAGPFTAKQLLWMFGCGGALLVLWSLLEKTAFFLVAVPVILIFGALAFYRPYNQPLIKFVFYSFMFLFRPKIYVWRRIAELKSHRKRTENQATTQSDKKKEQLVSSDIDALAKMLDSQGQERSERIMQIIRQRQGTKNK